MSSSYSADRHPDSGHPDRGGLADAIAGVAAPAVSEHLAGCRDCSARLAALTTASNSVSQYLRTDPPPELPAAVAARFADAIAAESAARPAKSTSAISSPATSTPAVAAPHRSPLRAGRRRDGWWARHTRLGGVLVTAAALVVVGGGGTVVANWVRDGHSTNQAGAGRTSATQEDSAAPGNELGLGKATPPGTVAGTIALHRAAFVDEIGDVLSARTRTLRGLRSAQSTCASDALADGDLDGATLTALSGAFTLDGTPVLVVVAAHNGTRTAVTISGCSSGEPQAAARGDLP